MKSRVITSMRRLHHARLLKDRAAISGQLAATSGDQTMAFALRSYASILQARADAWEALAGGDMNACQDFLHEARFFQRLMFQQYRKQAMEYVPRRAMQRVAERARIAEA